VCFGIVLLLGFVGVGDLLVFQYAAWARYDVVVSRAHSRTHIAVLLSVPVHVILIHFVVLLLLLLLLLPLVG
jgi:hypothetical protein